MADAKPAAAQPARKKVTIPMLVEKMKKGEPIVQLAVYDYETAIIADRVGIDILCVSDTGGMVLFGHETTTSVSFEEVMFMAQAVKRGSKYGLRMVDMPYMSFHLSAQQAVDNAAKYVSQGGAEVMKCEGNQHHAKYIEAIVKAGIPVQGHIGITPMRMPQLGGFFAQGKTAERAKELVDDAWAMVDAGCFSIMCEVTTSEVCEYLAETLPVPVISLGAGNRAHGVHIIGSDLFHLYEAHVPRHSKIYVDLVPIIEKGLSDYRDDVRARRYPGPEHTVFMKEDELAKFKQLVGKQQRKPADVLAQARFFAGLTRHSSRASRRSAARARSRRTRASTPWATRSTTSTSSPTAWCASPWAWQARHRGRRHHPPRRRVRLGAAGGGPRAAHRHRVLPHALRGRRHRRRRAHAPDGERRRASATP